MRPFSIGLLCSCLLAIALPAADEYPLGPDSKAQEGVPKGEVTKYNFDKSKIFPGTWREYWVYVPKQYDGLGDNYARFVLDEILPEVVARTGLNLSTNGNDRAIAGASSGAICAFT